MAPDKLGTLPVETGTELYRCHQAFNDPIHFGRDASHRFDDPDRRFGVCYLASTAQGAFAETLIRKPAGQVLQRSDLETFCISSVPVNAPLELVHCYGAGLHRNGLDSRISATTQYRTTQALARDFHQHSQHPDGLIYRARHDDDQLSIALFGRASGKLGNIQNTLSWIATGTIIESILDRYEIALIR